MRETNWLEEFHETCQDIMEDVPLYLHGYGHTEHMKCNRQGHLPHPLYGGIG